MAQTLNKSIRFVATDRDLDMLEQLALQDGNASMSAMLRKLIRREAECRGLLPTAKLDQEDAQAEHVQMPA